MSNFSYIAICVILFLQTLASGITLGKIGEIKGIYKISDFFSSFIMVVLLLFIILWWPE